MSKKVSPTAFSPNKDYYPFIPIQPLKLNY